MNLVLLSCWSSLFVFMWLVRSKHYWTAPAVALLFVFVLGGAGSTLPALLCNTFLSRETELWVLAANREHCFLGFLIGAGLSEEFWKMSAGLVVLLLLDVAGRLRAWGDDRGGWPARSWRALGPVLDRDVGDADRALGFVVVGLTFASIENWLSYGGLEPGALMMRGMVAVPLHATLGLMHGVGVNAGIRRGRAWPLFAAYLAAVILHAGADTWSLAFPAVDARLVLPWLISVLVLWFTCTWRRIPEIAAEKLAVSRRAGAGRGHACAVDV